MANKPIEHLYFDSKKFRSEMFRRSFTYEELSNKTGISQATIFKAMKDGYMTSRTYKAINELVPVEIEFAK